MGDWHNYDFAGKRALLVEDNLINTFVQQKMLEAVGFQVITAENGKLGVEQYKAFGEGYFDVILMDINMPIMDGWAATRQIRNLKRSDAPTIPIIAITTSDYQEDICKSEAAGMNEHLVKPIVPEVLFRCLTEYL